MSNQSLTPGQPIFPLLALLNPREQWGFLLLMLHGADVIEASLFGLASGRQSRGHRFHHAGPVHVADADTLLGFVSRT